MEFCRYVLCMYFYGILSSSSCQIYELLNISTAPPEDPVSIIKFNGYPVEEHETVTDDGYILRIYRMPNIKSTTNSKPPILLMHGMVSSSADFVNFYPNISLGYILWNAGYDVWLGNARGNSYCKKHKIIDETKNPKEFYNFSWHEIGIYDIPAMIDYVIYKTNHKNIYYIGHSQGGTSFYVAMSVRPEYNKKIRLASLMAPASLMSASSASFMRFLDKQLEWVKIVLSFTKMYHLPHLNSLRSFFRNLCTYSTYLLPVCKWLISATFGPYDGDQSLPSLIPTMLRTSPSDISLRQVLHYVQLKRNGKFCEYDYGSDKNMEIYGKAEPPEYSVDNISAPIAVYYAERDGIVNATDLRTFIKRLPNIVMEYVVPLKDFSHIDFLWAKDANRLFHKVLLNIMKKY